MALPENNLDELLVKLAKVVLEHYDVTLENAVAELAEQDNGATAQWADDVAEVAAEAIRTEEKPGSDTISMNPVKDRAEELADTMTAKQLQKFYEDEGGTDTLRGSKAEIAMEVARFLALKGETATDGLTDDELIKLPLADLRSMLAEQGKDYDRSWDKEELIKALKSEATPEAEDEPEINPEELTMDKIKAMTTTEIRKVAVSFGVENADDMDRDELLGLFEEE